MRAGMHAGGREIEKSEKEEQRNDNQHSILQNNLHVDGIAL
jgi:hypothetical protein